VNLHDADGPVLRLFRADRGGQAEEQNQREKREDETVCFAHEVPPFGLLTYGARRPGLRSRSAPAASVIKKSKLSANTTAPPVGTRRRVEIPRPPTPARKATAMLHSR